MPGGVYLHRSGRIPRQPDRKISQPVRDRHVALHLLWLLRRSVPVRCDPDGFRDASRQSRIYPERFRRKQRSADESVQRTRRKRKRRALRGVRQTVPACVIRLAALGAGAQGEKTMADNNQNGSTSNGITTQPLPASKKVYVQSQTRADVRVPMRAITLAGGGHGGNGHSTEPVLVYDTSGPYTGGVETDIRKGLEPLRLDWIKARGDVE